MVAPAMLEGFILLGPDDLEPFEREELAARVVPIALPSRSVQQLVSPEFMANAASREFAALLMREPLLSAKVISRVNSAFYGLASPIGSVSHAVTYLGMNTVRNMALQFFLEQAFATDDPELRAFHSRLFDTAAIAADLATVLAHRLGVPDSGTASTQAVLAFLGDFAMPSLLPPGSAIGNWTLGLLERTCNEQIRLGTNAMTVGQLLLDALDVPPALNRDVADIHRVLVTPAPETLSAREARIALSYACARLAEGIVAGMVQEPEELDLSGPDEEFHHLQGYLAQPPLGRLPGCLRTREVQRALSRMIAAAGRSRDTAPELGRPMAER